MGDTSITVIHHAMSPTVLYYGVIGFFESVMCFLFWTNIPKGKFCKATKSVFMAKTNLYIQYVEDSVYIVYARR